MAPESNFYVTEAVLAAMASATQRASALLLALLPVGIIGILFLISPSYIARLFQPAPDDVRDVPAGRRVRLTTARQGDGGDEH